MRLGHRGRGTPARQREEGGDGEQRAQAEHEVSFARTGCPAIPPKANRTFSSKDKNPSMTHAQPTDSAPD
jgi:hypothetical protein